MTSTSQGTFALFNDSFPPIMDGVSICVYNYAKHLTAMGEKAIVVTPEAAPNDKDKVIEARDTFSVYRYPSFPLPFHKPHRVGLFLFAYPLARRLYKSDIRLVHAHCPFSSGLIAKKIATQKGIPMVATFHSKYRYDFERVIKSKALVDLIIKNIVEFYEEADEVWVPQEEVAETLFQYGYKGKRPIVMPNGNDLSERTDRDALRVARRRQLGITDDCPLLLYVGQQTREKNVPFILQSLHDLGDLPYQMVSVGDGYGLEEFKKLAQSLGIGEKVLFTGSIYDRDTLASYYAAADLFLFPSNYDTWGLVFREAAAMQTPSLLLANSTAATVIKDHFNGYLSIESPTEYAQKIAQILSNPEERNLVARHAQVTLAESWSAVVERVHDRYMRLLH